MAPTRPRDRDAGMHKISLVTRILAGAGVAFAALFSAFLAHRAAGSGGNPNPTPAIAPSSADPSASSGSSAEPVPPTDPYANEPIPRAQPHTRTGGS
ncbi:MAG TPA: hypothetical protein VEP49_03785 [Acidimicrobiia bacterium]|nr:hypothetical protein [Acidimicrobiia bacterium]